MILEDDDDIDWKPNPFDVDSNDEMGSPMSKSTFEGSPQLQISLKASVFEFIDVFASPTKEDTEARCYQRVAGH